MTLDQFVNELISRSASAGFQLFQLTQMRDEYGTVSAVQALVERSEDTSGLAFLVEHELQGWSLEAAVVNYPNHFPSETVGLARSRLAKIKHM